MVERGPDVLTLEEALGEKWGMSCAVDPDADASPGY